MGFAKIETHRSPHLGEANAVSRTSLCGSIIKGFFLHVSKHSESKEAKSYFFVLKIEEGSIYNFQGFFTPILYIIEF